MTPQHTLFLVEFRRDGEDDKMIISSLSCRQKHETAKNIHGLLKEQLGGEIEIVSFRKIKIEEAIR